MKAVKVHGGEETSRRISDNVGGLDPMADTGDEVLEAVNVL